MKAVGRFVRVRGASEHNLREIDVDIPRDALVVFTGVSGSGKSSLAFGTLYAEAQRRYFESVAPYARRLLQQVGAPRVREITGLPPAVALRQQRGTPSARSTVGTITTLSNLLRMLYSRAGTYPPGAPRAEAETFSPNTVAGACPSCHGLGTSMDVAEELLVPDPSLSVRDGAIAAWPGAWQGANLRSVVMGLGIDIDRPWRKLKKKDRDWLLFTDEQPTVVVAPEQGRTDWGYEGKFWSARAHVMHVLADSKSPRMRERAMRFVHSAPCNPCGGTGLRPEALAVTFAGDSIARVNAMPFTRLSEWLQRVGEPVGLRESLDIPLERESGEVAWRLCGDMAERVQVLIDLGLGYLSLGRRSTTLSPGESQRLRLATQLRAGLFGVLYVLDEPSAGLHPADAEPLLEVLESLKESGNSLFIVEHDMDVVRRADWVVDIGPAAGEGGGRVLYSGPVAGLEHIKESPTSWYLFGRDRPVVGSARVPQAWLRIGGISRNNLHDVTVAIPLNVFTAVTGVSGSGKSTLVSEVLAETVRAYLGLAPGGPCEAVRAIDLSHSTGLDTIDRLVTVDQRPIGRTPRSNLATYTGLFDAVRRLYASTEKAVSRGFGASQFSFNVAQGRCETCNGEGFIAVELLFLPGTYGPCPTCRGTRYTQETLEIHYHGKDIADVLSLSVDDAADFFRDVPAIAKTLALLQEVGLGYLSLGQPATELSGGEAQRIKLATELQRARVGHTLYLLDEPTTGLHPQDVALLLRQLDRLVAAGNTVVVIEHDLETVAYADWVIDLGPGGGEAGGRVIATGPPAVVAATIGSITGPYLGRQLQRARQD